MKSSQAREAFSALAQETRLGILRHLIREGLKEIPAGAVADKLKVPASTFSFHVASLERAGLVKSRRDQRQILYSADLDGVRELLAFLLQDCCGGRPEICSNLLDSLLQPACCEPAPARRVGRRAR